MDIQTIKFQTTDQALAEIETGCLIVGVFSDRAAHEQFTELDDATDGLLAELNSEGELSLGAGKTLMVHHPRGLKACRLLIT
ncbi:MAG: M17 family peptidase N-terminal domain-containing protein, partial [Wenzhouxiangellaceae bacterium]